MVRALLIRGMLTGVLAGLLAAGFAWLLGEPQVDLAFAFERHMHQMAGEAPEPALVSRTVQSTAGLATGVVVYGAALGGIFALVFAYDYGRIGRLTPRAAAAMLAAAGFCALVLVPQVKYPANPPAIGRQLGRGRHFISLWLRFPSSWPQRRYRARASLIGGSACGTAH